MIRYAFTTDPSDLFTVTIETGETDRVRALRKIIVVMGLECRKDFDDNHESEFERWLSTTGEDAIRYISEKYVLSNPQTSTLNALPNGRYSVNIVNGTLTITKRGESVCLCVSICIIMRDEILPRLRSMLGNDNYNQY